MTVLDWNKVHHRNERRTAVDCHKRKLSMHDNGPKNQLPVDFSMLFIEQSCSVQLQTLSCCIDFSKLQEQADNLSVRVVMSMGLSSPNLL